jgi:hypothetical protein
MRLWLKGMIRRLAYAYWQIIIGDDCWVNFNDKFVESIKNRIILCVMRESIEAQWFYSKESVMRGGSGEGAKDDVARGDEFHVCYFLSRIG